MKNEFEQDSHNPEKFQPGSKNMIHFHIVNI